MLRDLIWREAFMATRVLYFVGIFLIYMKVLLFNYYVRVVLVTQKRSLK